MMGADVTGAWDLVLNQEARIMRVLRRKYGSQLADDVWTNVILDKAERVTDTWRRNPIDPKTGAIIKGRNIQNHFFYSMIWYAHVWVKRQERQRRCEIQVGTDRCLIGCDTGDTSLIELQDLFDSMRKAGHITEFDEWLVKHIALTGYTLVETSEVLGVPPQTVGRWYKSAIERVRDNLRIT